MQIRILLGTPPIFTEAKRGLKIACRAVAPQILGKISEFEIGEGGRKAQKVVFVIARNAQD